jgi:hypothetical protein
MAQGMWSRRCRKQMIRRGLIYQRNGQSSFCAQQMILQEMVNAYINIVGGNGIVGATQRDMMEGSSIFKQFLFG